MEAETSNTPVQEVSEVSEEWKKPGSSYNGTANLKPSGAGRDCHPNGVNSKLENALFGAQDSWQHIAHEKPVHRTMQTMRSKGFSVDEIASFTGYSKGQVTSVLSQPFAQANIINDIKRSVSDEVKEFLESEVMPSLRVLTNLRDDPEVPAAVRANTAVSIIDRLMGKPNQPISTQVAEPSKLTNDELTKRVSTILGSGLEAAPRMAESNEGVKVPRPMGED